MHFRWAYKLYVVGSGVQVGLKCEIFNLTERSKFSHLGTFKEYGLFLGLRRTHYVNVDYGILISMYAADFIFTI